MRVASGLPAVTRAAGFRLWAGGHFTESALGDRWKRVRAGTATEMESLAGERLVRASTRVEPRARIETVKTVGDSRTRVAWLHTTTGRACWSGGDGPKPTPAQRASGPCGTFDRCDAVGGGIPQHFTNSGVAGCAAIARPRRRFHLADRGQPADCDRRLNRRTPDVQTPADNFVARLLLHPGTVPRGCDHATTSSTHSPLVPRRGY